MCIGRPSVPAPTPDFNNVAPITGMSAQDIQNFLLKYPTSVKASKAGLDVNQWAQIASTDVGLDFLKAHSANRRSAGAVNEANEIDAAIQGITIADQTRAATGGTSKLMMPTYAPPPAEKSAQYVEQAGFNNPLLMHPTNPLRIPLITPQTPQG